MLAHFSLLWLIFSIFLRILSHLVFLIHFFGVVARIFEVLGGSGEGFWEVFSMIFNENIEKRDLVKISVSPRQEQENQGFDL